MLAFLLIACSGLNNPISNESGGYENGSGGSENGSGGSENG